MAVLVADLAERGAIAAPAEVVVVSLSLVNQAIPLAAKVLLQVASLLCLAQATWPNVAAALYNSQPANTSLPMRLLTAVLLVAKVLVVETDMVAVLALVVEVVWDLQ